MLELRGKMQSLDYINNKISDAYYLHGAASAKAIAEQYKPALQQREAWRTEYNEVEAQIAELEALIAEEEAETINPADDE